ncbi:MAG: hypothetical protein Q8Q23_06255, partial [bacterium]|nr:hypothetical protein [bacterium]
MRKITSIIVIVLIIASIMIVQNHNHIAQAALTDGLQAHWTFDEGSGVTAGDSAGSNTGTISGATWTSGKIGSSALSFDGTSDTI